MFKIYYTSFFLITCLVYTFGQTPTVAPAQNQPIYISGATAHLGNGIVIENSLVAFSEGKITYVGTTEEATNIDLSSYQHIQAEGQHVYPGFIAPVTNLGLVDIRAVRATRDFDEVGAMNPNIRSLIAYNTDSPIIPTVRARGVLLAQSTPQGGRIAGSSSIVQLDAWNWEDAAYLANDGIHLNWPRVFNFSWRNRSHSANENYGKQVQEIVDFFAEAKAYLENPAPTHENLKFEAMRTLFKGDARLFINARDAKQILHAIQFSKDIGIKVVIVDGRDSWMLTDQLKKNNIPVILRATQNLPARVDSDIDQTFKTPAILQDAGVLFCFSQSGFWQQRNLPFQAGQAIGYGLKYEEAIAALTSNTATILGIDDRTGTLEKGKDANLFIARGDVLDVRTNQIIKAFIQGRDVNLDNIQKQLYEKYKSKYEPIEK